MSSDRYLRDAPCFARLAVGAAALALLLGTSGCETRRIGQDRSSGGSASQGSGKQLVFSDRFEREQFGSNWSVGEGDEGGTGEWTIKNGRVQGQNIHNDPLWLDRKLPKDVRIEFDARALSDRGDLKVEVFGDGVHHQSGYILIFGGWENRLDVIARLDEHGDDRKERPSRQVEKGQTYRMAIERTDGTLEWFVDGELFMTYEDDNPLRGDEHRYFAFSNWEAPVQFDNVKVYKL